jgi:glycosyltransferase involved in cell wall biosynthesis
MARITISMPCYGRPVRTARAIDCIRRQTVQDFEAFVIGDGCPVFEPVTDDSRFISFNTPENHGGCGYAQTNLAISRATGPFFIFFANDDIISPAHMATYLDQIEGTDYDFVYFDYLAYGKLVKTRLRYGKIGHSALIIRTAFLKEMPPHSPKYGHDFDLIRNMTRAGAKYRKADRIIPTYYVMSGNKHRDPEDID